MKTNSISNKGLLKEFKKKFTKAWCGYPDEFRTDGYNANEVWSFFEKALIKARSEGREEVYKNIMFKLQCNYECPACVLNKAMFSRDSKRKPK